MAKKAKHSLPFGTFLLLGLAIGMMVGVVFVDYEWTLYLIDHRWEKFAKIMERSIFEGEAFGGGDPVFFYILAVLVLYGGSYSSKAPYWLQSWRSVLGFISFVALATGLGLVQNIKWALGRTRPYLVIREELGYSEWYEFGQHYIADGVFFGSFPSGHTATSALLLTLAYVLIGDPLLKKKWHWLGWGWGFLVLAYALTMAVGRSMDKAHWISDGLGAILLIWGLNHWLYYWVLKIPAQRLYFKTYQQSHTTFRFWEIRLCGYFLLIALGITCLLIAFNAFQRQSPLWLGWLLLPMGVALVWIFTRKAQVYYQICTKNLGSVG